VWGEHPAAACVLDKIRNPKPPHPTPPPTHTQPKGGSRAGLRKTAKNGAGANEKSALAGGNRFCAFFPTPASEKDGGGGGDVPRIFSEPKGGTFNLSPAGGPRFVGGGKLVGLSMGIYGKRSVCGKMDPLPDRGKRTVKEKKTGSWNGEKK